MAPGRRSHSAGCVHPLPTGDPVGREADFPGVAGEEHCGKVSSVLRRQSTNGPRGEQGPGCYSQDLAGAAGVEQE